MIDVGVADGTFPLYDTFPDARLLLIDPLVEYRPRYEAIARRYGAEYVLAALGSAEGTGVLHVHRDLASSSLLHEHEGPAVDGAHRPVPVTTLDAVCRGRDLPPPMLLKLDVQGYELEVLRGAEEALRRSGAVVLEVSLFEFYRGCPDLPAVLAFMRTRSFAVYDLVGQLYRPLDGALAQVDVVFVAAAGPFRATHAFATAEQRLRLENEWGHPPRPPAPQE